MTPKQLARKVETSRRHLGTAIRDLDAAIADYRERAPFLTFAERDMWTSLVYTAVLIEDARARLADTESSILTT